MRILMLENQGFATSIATSPGLMARWVRPLNVHKVLSAGKFQVSNPRVHFKWEFSRWDSRRVLVSLSESIFSERLLIETLLKVSFSESLLRLSLAKLKWEYSQWCYSEWYSGIGYQMLNSWSENSHFFSLVFQKFFQLCAECKPAIPVFVGTAHRLSRWKFGRFKFQLKCCSNMAQLERLY